LNTTVAKILEVDIIFSSKINCHRSVNWLSLRTILAKTDNIYFEIFDAKQKMIPNFANLFAP